MDEFKFALGIACLLMGAIILACVAAGMMTGLLPSPNPTPHVPTIGEWIVVGGVIVGAGLVVAGLVFLALYFSEQPETVAVNNVYEVAVLAIIIAIAGILTYLGVLDKNTFVNIVVLILGYLAKTAVEYVRARL